MVCSIFLDEGLLALGSLILYVSGHIVSLNLAGQPMVILNTHKVASDLLSKGCSRTIADNPPESSSHLIRSPLSDLQRQSPVHNGRYINRRAEHRTHALYGPVSLIPSAPGSYIVYYSLYTYQVAPDAQSGA